MRFVEHPAEDGDPPDRRRRRITEAGTADRITILARLGVGSSRWPGKRAFWGRVEWWGRLRIRPFRRGRDPSGRRTNLTARLRRPVSFQRSNPLSLIRLANRRRISPWSCWVRRTSSTAAGICDDRALEIRHRPQEREPPLDRANDQLPFETFAASHEPRQTNGTS